MLALESVFAADGPLARTLPHYRPRPGQMQMALAVASAIESQRALLAEAGTGIGKTYAYLVPAILSGRRVIVSTGTRNLQDQLYGGDLPVLRRALALPLRTGLLKGRSNYLCHYRLAHRLEVRMGQRPHEAAQVEVLRRWSRTTTIGDKSEVAEVPDDSPLWHAVTSTTDNCLGQECPNLSDCCVVAARRSAHEAQVLIVNHHLLWADWALKDDGLGELLPTAEVVVVDEAHQFAEAASQFLGTHVGSRQLEEWSEDLHVELGKFPGEHAELANRANRLSDAVYAARCALGGSVDRAAWTDAQCLPEVRRAFSILADCLEDIGTALGGTADRSAGLESCRHRFAVLRERLEGFVDEDPNAQSGVRWIEVHRRGFQLNHTPIDVAEDLARCHEASSAAWIFTSATLTSEARFDETARTLGLTDFVSVRCESPFDYRHQCLAYLPRGLPDPSNADYTARVVEVALPVLAASGGRAFMLFTSHQALSRAAELLSSIGLRYPLFVQGSQPKALLLDRFQRAGNGVLLGTASFWEGVDVRGAPLSCVIIDKLPFAAPSDPVLAARIKAVKARGDDPFFALQLPAAILTLRQGFGRLIRDIDDRGVFVLCDPRVATRTYGQRFLASLPDMPRTHSLDDVEAFFADARPEEGSAGG